MSVPVITCLEENTVTEIAQLLAKHQISSVVVVDRQGGPKGIVTEKSLVKVLASSEKQGRLSARDVMEQAPIILPPTALFQEALLSMVQRQQKHVMVVDRGLVRGIVTLADLVRTQNVDALSALNSIERAKDVVALEGAVREIDRVVVGLVAGQAGASEIGAIVSELYDRLTARLIFFAEEDLYAEGKGRAPCGYCWLALGSAGRREQIIRTDLDNAMIYEDPPAGKESAYREYFLSLGEKVTAALIRFGFEPCPGRVMANNPAWCKSFKEWVNTVRSWAMEPQGEWLRNMTIFFDFRPVYGRFELAGQLRATISQWFKKYEVVLHYLAKDALAKRIPLNPFRQFITEKTGLHKNELDLKRAVLIHLVDCIRLYALREGLPVTSTFDRLKGLIECNVFREEDAESFRLAYDGVLMLRLRQNLERQAQGLKPTNHIDPRRLSRREQNAVRDALLTASRLQYLVGMSFRVS